jgi:FkbM family methyltransferase
MFKFLNKQKIKLKDYPDIELVIPRSKRIKSVIENRVFTKKYINETKKLFETIGYPKTILDIGANVGYQAIHYFLSSPETKIYCFEPSPYNFRYLSSNIEKFNNIKSFNMGLGNEDSTGYLSMPSHRQNPRISKMKNNTGLLSFYGDGKKYNDAIEITTLDNWLSNNKVDLINGFIKIDVEGFELKVCEGMSKLLMEIQPVIQIEMNPATLIMSNTTIIDIVAHLKSFSYLPYIIINNVIEECSINNLDSEKVVDLLFIKNGAIK